MSLKYREALLRIADGLCESDELEGDQIKAIVAEYTDVTEAPQGPVRIAHPLHLIRPHRDRTRQEPEFPVWAVRCVRVRHRRRAR